MACKNLIILLDVLKTAKDVKKIMQGYLSESSILPTLSHNRDAT